MVDSISSGARVTPPVGGEARAPAPDAKESIRAQTAASAEQQQAPARAAEPSLEATKQAAQRIEAYLRSKARSLEFRVDQGTGRTVVTVRDTSTGDVVRQIPGEDALRLSEQIEKQLGALLDTKA